MPDVLKYLLVDDDELDRLAIEAQASRYPYLHKVAACSQALEAFELISRFRPDIVFADIEMPGMSGVELVNLLAGQVPAPVFITSHPEYALESYEMKVFDYLLKPLTPDRFSKCAARLFDFFQLRASAFAFDAQQVSNCLTIKQGHEKYKLNIPDILYLEAMKDYTRIITTGKQYLVLKPLSVMLEQLPAENFIRIHRSFVINKDKVKAVKGGKVSLSEVELPVGKLYKNSLNGIL